MAERRVPRIRFKGFEEDWEQRKFSDLYEKSSEKNDGSIGVDRNITVASMQFKTDVRVNTVEYLKTYYTFRLGDIAFEGHQSKEFRFGRFVENDIGDGIVSHIFAVFRPMGHYDLRYWKYAINNERLMQRVLSHSTKASTMMHDLVEKDFLNELFLVPSVKEQRSIGEFLFSVDRSISLHQRKLEKLKILKKAMLEKMFPKNGEKVPEIRFSGFTEDWEQRKLEELVIFNPKANIPEIFEYVDLESVVGTKMISHRSESKRTAPSRAQRLAQVGDLFYQTVRPYQKNNYLFERSDGYYVFSTGYAQMRPLVSGEFLFSLIQNEEFVKIVLDKCTGTSYPAINVKDLGQITVFLPESSREQRQIGRFSQYLDTLLSLHQRKLEKLRQIKKSMLERMFV